MPDYAAKARALRAKAADPVVPDTERRALLEKAAELEKKYGGTGYFSFTVHAPDDTTVTSRDGNPFARPYGWKPPPSSAFWDQYLQDLLNRQHTWNRPPATDEEDIVEETYQWQASDDEDDEDYGYEVYNE